MIYPLGPRTGAGASVAEATPAVISRQAKSSLTGKLTSANASGDTR